jgi:hypothetical protein
MAMTSSLQRWSNQASRILRHPSLRRSTGISSISFPLNSAPTSADESEFHAIAQHHATMRVAIVSRRLLTTNPGHESLPRTLAIHQHKCIVLKANRIV